MPRRFTAREYSDCAAPEEKCWEQVWPGDPAARTDDGQIVHESCLPTDDE